MKNVLILKKTTWIHKNRVLKAVSSFQDSRIEFCFKLDLQDDHKSFY